MMKELVISLLVIFFIAGCAQPTESKPDFLNDGRRLEQNKARMSSENETRGAIIFVYVNDGFYNINATLSPSNFEYVNGKCIQIGRDPLRFNEETKYQRYFYDPRIRTKSERRIPFESIYETFSTLSFEEFCEQYLVKERHYYRLKILEEYFAKRREFIKTHDYIPYDNIFEYIDFERENMPDNNEVENLFFAAQYYYDFFIEHEYEDTGIRLHSYYYYSRDRKYELFIEIGICMVVASAFLRMIIHQKIVKKFHRKKYFFLSLLIITILCALSIWLYLIR